MKDKGPRVNAIGEDMVLVRCGHCDKSVEVPFQTVTGDPRNLAMQFHADAFFPHKTSQKTNLDGMSITFLNMEKALRVKVKNIFLCSFIRKTKADSDLYKTNPRFLSAFYAPLMEEIQDLLINGFEIDYQHTEASLVKFGINPGPMKIWAIILNHTGDLKGLQALCSIKSGGKSPCRCCTSESEALFKQQTSFDNIYLSFVNTKS